jgi:aspartyl protease family protein
VFWRYGIFAACLLVMVVVLAPVLDRLAPGAVVAGSSDAPPPAPTASAAPIGGSLVIDRDGSGLFRVQVVANGQPIRMVVDTGADAVGLSEADARQIGIVPDAAAFTQTVTTASGQSMGARVHIDRLELGGRDLGGSDAVVVQGLGTSLLGQSVLRRIGPVTLSGDRLTIGQ